MFLPSNITLKFGDSGDFVTELQRRLSVARCFDANAINGFYDGNTTNAVSSFQSKCGLRADGIAGPETLRRLNGALSGDSGSTNAGAQEDEKRAAQASQQMAQAAYLMENPILSPQSASAPLSFTEPQAAPAVSPATPPVEPATYQQPVPQQQQPAPPLQPQSPNPNDLLAQMLLNQQPKPSVPLPPEPTQPPPMATQPQQQIPPAYMQAPPPATQTPTPEPPRSAIGRAAQYVSETIQKLAVYFESKLPTHVLNEVKEIGLTMAKSGMKEAPIPAGPEQQRERGPEQQRGPQQSIQRS